VTTLGRSLLQTWLLRPSCSLSVIKARHDAVACLLLPENLTITDDIRSQLKGIRNVPRCLSRIKSGRAKIAEWQGLVKVRLLIFTPRSDAHTFATSSVHVSHGSPLRHSWRTPPSYRRRGGSAGEHHTLSTLIALIETWISSSILWTFPSSRGLERQLTILFVRSHIGQRLSF
jgi:DNA mismatch repair ATPase MutS